MMRLITITVLITLCGVAYVSSQGIPGGLKDEKQADSHIKDIISSVHHEIKGKYQGEIMTIEPISYRTQVVAGTNYFIKARITEKNGRESHAHLRIYKPFSGKNELTSILTDVTKEQPLKYFQ